jgi:hypothetical protein
VLSAAPPAPESVPFKLGDRVIAERCSKRPRCGNPGAACLSATGRRQRSNFQTKSTPLERNMIALAASYSLGPGDHLPEYLIRYLLLRAIDLFGWSQEARNR